MSLDTRPIGSSDMAIIETTVNRTIPTEEINGHFLMPGEICISLDDPNLATDACVGVVILSGGNTNQSVEVKFGNEPIRQFDRKRLMWLGAIG